MYTEDDVFFCNKRMECDKDETKIHETGGVIACRSDDSAGAVYAGGHMGAGDGPDAGDCSRGNGAGRYGAADNE